MMHSSPLSLEERLVKLSLRLTIPLYLVGGLYIAGPALGWCLGGIAVVRWASERLDAGAPRTTRISMGTSIWTAAMLVMLLALVIGHVEHSLGVAKTIKSTIGWAKGWALLALFPLAGSARIRPELLYRGACELGLQALVLLPVCWLAARVGLPEVLWVSPTQIVGGPGPEFFAVRLYSVDPSGGFRYWLFTPWAPALGFLANLYLVLALRERDLKWRSIGALGACAMIVASGSRLGLVAAVFVQGVTWAAFGLLSPTKWLAASGGSLGVVVFHGQLTEIVQNILVRFHAARQASSQVRQALGRIAIDRWRDEAPIWGHGIVERGPHLVEFMPIGSHHTWYGLLFVKGAVGFCALALALGVSLGVLWIKGHECRDARVGFAVALALFAYSFGENLEILSYLFWPGLIALGIGLRSPWPSAWVSLIGEGWAVRRAEVRVVAA